MAVLTLVEILSETHFIRRLDVGISLCGVTEDIKIVALKLSSK